VGDLKDELRKKGLADDRRARQLSHEEKARKNRLGREAVEDERRRQEEERLARERARREQDRRRELERQQDDAARAARHALAQLLRDHALTRGVRGPRRFYFVARDRKILFLDLADDAAKRLESGALAICETPNTDPAEFVLTPADIAARVLAAAPEFVVFHNAPGARATE
jgi:hypothetical protein